MADNLSIYLAELDLPTRHGTRGYKRLADFMAWDPSTAILPRFRSANMFNLLGLQAEVCRLQDELMHLIERDSENAEQPQKDYANDWSVLQAGENGKSEQRLKILELRTKIAEYSRLNAALYFCGQQCSLILIPAHNPQTQHLSSKRPSISKVAPTRRTCSVFSTGSKAGKGAIVSCEARALTPGSEQTETLPTFCP
jgi:hypothetical protein